MPVQTFTLLHAAANTADATITTPTDQRWYSFAAANRPQVDTELVAGGGVSYLAALGIREGVDIEIWFSATRAEAGGTAGPDLTDDAERGLVTINAGGNELRLVGVDSSEPYVWPWSPAIQAWITALGAGWQSLRPVTLTWRSAEQPPARDAEVEKMGIAWAEASPTNRIEISDALRLNGWPDTYSDPGGDLPLRERLNQIYCELSAMGVEVSTRGVLEWSDEVDYIQYALVQRNGALYRSRQSTGPGSGSTAAATDPEITDNLVWQVLQGRNTVPNAPSVTASAGVNDLLVSRSTPFNGGSPILDYQIQWRTSSGSYATNRQATFTSGSYRITGLAVNTRRTSSGCARAT